MLFVLVAVVLVAVVLVAVVDVVACVFVVGHKMHTLHLSDILNLSCFHLY